MDNILKEKEKSISKLQAFKLKGRTAFSYEDIYIKNKDNGVFILDMWNQCNEKNIDMFPVKYVECVSPQEMYILKADNIIMGRGTDLC